MAGFFEGISALFGQGGALQTGGTLPAQQALVDKGLPASQGSILGMTPENFAAMLGTFGAALDGPDTWSGRLGAAAAGMGKGSLLSQAAQIQDIKNRDFLRSLITSNTGVSGSNGLTPTLLNNTPESFYNALGALGLPIQKPEEKEITIKTKPQTMTF